MRHFITVSSFVAFALAAVGCSSGDEEDKGSSKQAASAGEFCDALCSADAACDDKVDFDTCALDCERGAGLEFGLLRSDYAKGVQACAEGASCAERLRGDVYASCIEEELVKLSPSPAAESLCEAIEAKAEECSGSGLNMAACLSSVKTRNDGVLGEAKSCLAKNCETFLNCVNVTLNLKD